MQGMKRRKTLQKKFYDAINKDNVYKMNGQYVITGKGDSWNQAKSEIDNLYYSWIAACELLGQGEEEVISRIDKSELVNEFENDRSIYYFIDRKGIVGEPLIIDPNDEEQKMNLFLMLLYISSKLSDDAKNRIREYVKSKQTI